METQPNVVPVSPSQHYPLLSSLWSSTLFCLILYALAPTPVYPSSPAASHCPPSHSPPRCPLTTWHLFRFIPISWQTACVSPRGHDAAILTNQWQINQCYLFFPCLCCHWFFFCYFAVCGELNFAQLNWVHFAVGTNCNSARLSALRQALVLAGDETCGALFMRCAIKTVTAVALAEAEPIFIGSSSSLTFFSDEAC